jgi:hypothetical protein
VVEVKGLRVGVVKDIGWGAPTQSLNPEFKFCGRKIVGSII